MRRVIFFSVFFIIFTSIFVYASDTSNIYEFESFLSSDVIESDGGSSIDISDIFDFIVSLFVPDDDFYKNEISILEDKFKSKIPLQFYYDTIGRLKYVSSKFDGNPDAFNFSAEYMGSIISFELGNYIAPFLPQIRTIITGLYCIFIALYNYRQLLYLIRGSNYSSVNTSDDGV